MKTSRTIEHSFDTKWSPVVIVSVLFHLAVFSTLFLVPESFSTRISLGNVVYEVDLVDMPSGGPARKSASAKQKGELHAAIPKDIKTRRIPGETRKQEKPLIIAKRTAKEEAQLPKKSEVSASELIDKAISRIESRVKAEEHLEEALSKVEQRVNEEQAAKEPGPEDTAKAGIGIPATAMQIYLMEVEHLIKSNWAYPAAMERNKDLEAIVVLTVKSDGTVTQTKFQKRSSSPLSDDTVMKAVERSSPLPPFPEGYNRSYDEFEINFNLKDVEGD
jgi:colicin import membrane protein